MCLTVSCKVSGRGGDCNVTANMRCGLACVLALGMSSASGVAAQVVNDAYTFRLHGGHFYGPGPIVPDTELPDGRLSHIRFDLHTWHGYCEFANDGKVGSLLSDGSTR